MILITEMIVSCVLFTVMVMSTQRKDPLSGLHNMPIALQERVASLLQYKDVKSAYHEKDTCTHYSDVPVCTSDLYQWCKKLQTGIYQ